MVEGSSRRCPSQGGSGRPGSAVGWTTRARRQRPGRSRARTSVSPAAAADWPGPPRPRSLRADWPGPAGPAPAAAHWRRPARDWARAVPGAKFKPGPLRERRGRCRPASALPRPSSWWVATGARHHPPVLLAKVGTPRRATLRPPRGRERAGPGPGPGPGRKAPREQVSLLAGAAAQGLEWVKKELGALWRCPPCHPRGSMHTAVLPGLCGKWQIEASLGSDALLFLLTGTQPAGGWLRALRLALSLLKGVEQIAKGHACAGCLTRVE